MVDTTQTAETIRMIAQCDSNGQADHATTTKLVMGCIAKYPGITQVGISNLLKVSLAEVHLTLRRLVAEGKAERIRA